MKMVSPRYALALLAMIGLALTVHSQNTTAARTLSAGQVREQIINHKGQDLSKDTDGDGISDFLELQLGTDHTSADSDGDGTPDGIEVTHGLDPSTPNPAADIVYIVNRLAVPSSHKDGALTSDISNTGIVAGYALTHSTTSRDAAVRWDTKTGSVETATSTSDSYGWVVNDSGAIGGKYNGLALYWAPGSVARSVNRSSSDTMYSSGINSSGKIVGYLNSQFPGDTGAFAWEDKGDATGTFTHLPAPSGYRFPRADSINDKGQIVGVAFSISSSQKAGVIWNGATASIMFSAAGGTEAAFDDVWSINRNGAVLGYKSSRPAVWTLADGRKYLPTGIVGLPASVWDINAFGEVLGTLEYKTTLWRPDGSGGWSIIDVNSRILDPVVMTSFRGEGMNDAGQITGSYRDAGKYIPVVLTPILRPSLAVDANRDGVIKLASEDATDATSAVQPYRFWLNDDDDSGDMGGSDIPYATDPSDYVRNDELIGFGDSLSPRVNGRRDLIDFFPVFLDIRAVLETLPPSAPGVKYKLKHADSGLRFVYTNLTRAQAFDYLRMPVDSAPLTTGFGSLDPVNWSSLAPSEAVALPVTVDGVQLYTNFLNYVGSGADRGVILVEGCKPTTVPLVLSVEKDGNVIVEVKLSLSIAPVEQMYRRINLREGDDAPTDATAEDPTHGLVGQRRDTGLPTDLSEPVSFPDALSNGKWFVFVVGSNVGGQKMRGWQSETFKRLYWSGSKSRFIGVSWFGDPFEDGNDLVYEYHNTVRNAFTSAPKFAEMVNALPGPKTVAGHSAACLLIASAISDYGLSVNKTCLLEAAIARETFDGASADEIIGMVPAFWRDYPTAYWSANWYVAFTGTSDARLKLTWRNRFLAAANATTIHNFYSSTEEVLARYDGSPTKALVDMIPLPGSFAWVTQEKSKGDKLVIPIFAHTGSDYGGWGKNTKDPILDSDPLYWKWDAALGKRLLKTPGEIGTVESPLLRRHPVFEPGWGLGIGANRLSPPDSSPSNYTGPSWVFELYGAEGHAVVSDPAKRAQLLAEAIPALSLPSGTSHTNRFGDTGNYDSPVQFAEAAYWPRTPPPSGPVTWLHSDMREVAYLYVYRLFDQLSTISDN